MMLKLETKANIAHVTSKCLGNFCCDWCVSAHTSSAVKDKVLFCSKDNKVYQNIGVQLGCSSFKDAGTQCRNSKGTYH